jgi:hypothetical protein
MTSRTVADRFTDDMAVDLRTSQPEVILLYAL